MVKWGIALGGGGAPGVAAHLGLLHGLAAQGLVPSVCVGTSAGGLVAGALGGGADLADLVHAWSILAADPWRIWVEEAEHAVHFLEPSPTPGLIDLGRVLELVNELSGDCWLTGDVARWRPGYGVVVSDLTAARPEVVSAARPLGLTTQQALVGTAAFPGVFAGVRTADGHLLCDGGVYDMVPVQACRDLGAARVVGVWIGPPTEDVPTLLTALDLVHLVVSRLLGAEEGAEDPAPADVVIRVPTRGGLVDMHDFAEDYLAGVDAAYHALEQIREVISRAEAEDQAQTSD